MKLATPRYAQDLRRYYRLPSVQVSLTIVLSLFVMAIFIAFALRPTIVSIVTLKKTIEESQKTLQQLDTKVNNLQKASAVLETIKPQLPIINTSIPNKGAMYSPFTSTIETLSAQSLTQLENESLGSTLLFSRILAPFTPNKNQSVISMPYSVRVTGAYPDILAFLTKLLTMERVVTIDAITITREVATKSKTTIVSLNVSGSTFYLADDAQLQKALEDQKGKK